MKSTNLPDESLSYALNAHHRYTYLSGSSKTYKLNGSLT